MGLMAVDQVEEPKLRRSKKRVTCNDQLDVMSYDPEQDLSASETPLP